MPGPVRCAAAWWPRPADRLERRNGDRAQLGVSARSITPLFGHTCWYGCAGVVTHSLTGALLGCRWSDQSGPRARCCGTGRSGMT